MAMIKTADLDVFPSRLNDGDGLMMIIIMIIDHDDHDDGDDHEQHDDHVDQNGNSSIRARFGGWSIRLE